MSKQADQPKMSSWLKPLSGCINVGVLVKEYDDRHAQKRMKRKGREKTKTEV